MGDVVNLKQVRKRAARDQADKQAGINRAQFGRTKAERNQEQQCNARAKKMLEQHRIVPEDR